MSGTSFVKSRPFRKASDIIYKESMTFVVFTDNMNTEGNNNISRQLFITKSQSANSIDRLFAL